MFNRIIAIALIIWCALLTIELKEIKADVHQEVSAVEVSANEDIETETYVPEPTFALSDSERLIVECMVMGEAEGESYEGKILVAQCILNACLKDNIQPSAVRTKYKYYGWNTHPTDEVKQAVKEVFDNGYKATDEFVLYFYAPAICESSWHESLVYVTTEGGHRFFTIEGDYNRG